MTKTTSYPEFRRFLLFFSVFLIPFASMACADCDVHTERFSEGQTTYQLTRASLKGIELEFVTPDFTWIDAGPPANHSDTTCAELKKLHELAALRPGKKAEIECEMQMSCFHFGSFSLAEETAAKYPLTYNLLQNELRVVEPVIQLQKKKFDRPRPNQVDPTLTTLIHVPNHAAYPSGHTTQAMLLAYTLGRLNPNSQLAYFQDAIRIGRNREIAGLHYPSDTEAGGRLAKAFFEYLLNEPWFQAEMDAASKEWN